MITTIKYSISYWPIQTIDKYKLSWHHWLSHSSNLWSIRRHRSKSKVAQYVHTIPNTNKHQRDTILTPAKTLFKGLDYVRLESIQIWTLICLFNWNNSGLSHQWIFLCHHGWAGISSERANSVEVSFNRSNIKRCLNTPTRGCYKNETRGKKNQGNLISNLGSVSKFAEVDRSTTDERLNSLI